MEVRFDGTKLNDDTIVGLKYSSRLFNDGDSYRLGATASQTAVLETTTNSSPTKIYIGTRNLYRGLDNYDTFNWMYGSDQYGASMTIDEDGSIIINGALNNYEDATYQIGNVYVESGKKYTLFAWEPYTGVNNYIRVSVENDNMFDYDFFVDETQYGMPIGEATATRSGWAKVYITFLADGIAYTNYKVQPMIQEFVASGELKYEPDYGNTYLLDNKTYNNGKYTYELVDQMVNLNFKYDAKPLIQASQHTEQDGTKYVFLEEILQDICTKAGLEYQLCEDVQIPQKHITWYDSTITAREYVSMIAELISCYAYTIDNLLLITPMANFFTSYTYMHYEPTINLDECSDYEIGEHYGISKVGIDNDLFQPVGYGDDIDLYLNSNNVYITEQSDIQRVYNNMFLTSFNPLRFRKTFIRPYLPGQRIQAENGSVISLAQLDLEYNGGWEGECKLDVSTQKELNTYSITGEEDNYKRLKIEADRNKNEMTLLAETLDNDYSTTAETSAAISAGISANNTAYVDIEVAKKVNNSDYKKATIVAMINDDTQSQVKIEADSIDLTGYITATDLSTSGRTTINGGNITTGTINGNNVNVTNINASNITTGTMSANKISGGEITASTIRLANTVLGTSSSTIGSFRVDQFGLSYQDSTLGSIILYTYYQKSIMSSPEPALYIGNSSGTIKTTITKDGGETTGSWTNGSLEEYKKDFEKLDNALDIIKDIDIYKYHLKSDNDTDKKRIGLVIGDNYKYSQEITSKDNNGVDLYSYISVCVKAIQEQQQQIDELKQEIKKLKG